MRLTIPGYLLLGVFVLITIYLLFIASVFVQTLSLDSDKRNSISYRDITVSVPKEAYIGETVDITVYHYPGFSSNIGLTRILFFDREGLYDFDSSIELYNPQAVDDKYPQTIGFMPYYETFTYIIPRKVCIDEENMPNCKLINTKIGEGKIALLFDPIVSEFFSDDPYRGDGDRIEVPINIKEK